MDLWRQKQKESFTNLDTLIDFLELDQHNRSLISKNHFPLLLPRRLAEKIAKNRLDDPIALQFIPQAAEAHNPPGYLLDPVHDRSFQKCSKLLHKYDGRALIVATGACAMHCRYCFRKNFDYGASTPDEIQEAIDYVKKTPSLHEVILSGGDPLSLSDRALSLILEELDAIPHVQIIRFHTRFPVGIPERITDSFIEILKKSSKQIVFIVHINHPKECDKDLFTALKKVGELNIPLLCQTVLLKGVNDDKKTLKELFLLLISHGVLPYYLHQLDRVTGSSHFEVVEEKGLALIEALRRELPGYAIPEYVLEIAGEPYKSPISVTTLKEPVITGGLAKRVAN